MQEKIVFALSLLLFSFHISETIHILEPNSSIPFLDDVPLWLRIRFESEKNENEQCFSVFLNNVYALATCEENTLIESKLLPGNHILELHPSNLRTSNGNRFRHEFQVLEPKERLPAHLSKDGWTLSLPPFIDDYHVFWYNSAVWYVDVHVCSYFGRCLSVS
jgi:hypothetical protein